MTQQLTREGQAAQQTSRSPSPPVVGIFRVLNGARPLVSGTETKHVLLPLAKAGLASLSSPPDILYCKYINLSVII